MLVSKYESRKGENDFSRFRLFFFFKKQSFFFNRLVDKT